jgi:acetylornithine/succinyldiaminopimelate/putrescine aminotransferase
MEYPQCGLYCLEFVQKVIEKNTAGSLAAIIVEPMQGTAGNVIPPPEFLPGILEIAHENDALLIADEMITGFGRPGTMFGSNYTGVLPDIMTIGKGMGNGFPISGLVAKEEITRSKPFSKPSSSSSSYGGNPLASTAALATVQTILEESLVENSRTVGATDELAALNVLAHRGHGMRYCSGLVLSFSLNRSFLSAHGCRDLVSWKLEQIFWAGVGLLIYTTLLVKKEEGGLHLNKEVSDDGPRSIQ